MNAAGFQNFWQPFSKEKFLLASIKSLTNFEIP
jgi:hypothetical protein